MEKENPSQQIWYGVLSQGTAVSDQKKHRIIEATVDIIARKGIEALTFENIGNELETTKANIKYHFQDKDQLIFTAVRLVVTNAQALTARAVEKAATPEEKLFAIIESVYEWYQRFPEHVKVWAFFMYNSHIHTEYSQFFHEARKAGQGRMQLLLRALCRGESKPPERLAENIQNILYGQMISLTGGTKELKNSKSDSIEMISALLKSKGIKWPKY